jgi:O-antigen ligase
MAVMAGAVFLLIEVLTDQAIRRAIFSLLPFTRPPSKHATVMDGEVVAIGPYILNRNMAALCLVLGPVLLMLRTLLDARRTMIAGIGLVAVSLIAVLKSEHETSMIALVLACAAFAGMVLAAPVMRKAITVGWVIATLLVVPMVTLAYKQQLHFAEWLPVTARNRVILWGYTAGEVMKTPILGIGVASTKELDKANADKAIQPPGYTYPLRTAQHSHNIFLQTWYELGAIGAALLLAMGLCALALLSRLPRGDQALAFASFVAAVLIGSFTWGIWQTWFMAAYGIWALLLALALEGSRRQQTRG